jgi:membrane associated rhomboid family serine protease
MPRAFPGFGGGLSSLPRSTRTMLVVFVAASVLDAIVARWLHGPELALFTALVPGEVAQGEVWRLVTYPWLAGDPLALIFGVMLLVFFASSLERSWGRRLFITRTALLAVVPAAVTTLVGLALPSVAYAPYVGLSALGLCWLTAFAADLRNARVTLFPLPLVLSGDQLLWFEGGMLLLWMLFSGSPVPYLNDAVAFSLALAWFRFGAFEGLRRRWLRLRKGRVESRLERLARERRLRVVRDDDDESRFLH